MNIINQIKDKTEELLGLYEQEGINVENIDLVMKLVDIHKDISNEEYWKEKIDKMYGNYNNGSFGRRGVPGTGRRRSYRGEDEIENMRYHYGNYADGRSYGEDEYSDKSFDKMVNCLESFVYTIMEEADDQHKIEKIKKIARKISDM